VHASNLTLTLLLLSALTVFAAALVSGMAGFAFSALAAAPLLRLLDDPVRVVCLMIACSIAIQGYCVWALRHSIEWRALRPFLAGGVAAVPLGTWVLARSSPWAFALGMGVFLTIYGAYMLCRGKARMLRGGALSDSAIGALGGFMGGLAGLPGLAVTIWCGVRGWSKERQRSTCQPFILLMQLEAIGVLGFKAPAAIPLDTLLFVPVAMVAAIIGFALFKRMSTGQFNKAVFSMLLISGLAQLGTALG
jgi:uncharacterized membrane protein YfcA